MSCVLGFENRLWRSICENVLPECPSKLKHKGNIGEHEMYFPSFGHWRPSGDCKELGTPSLCDGGSLRSVAPVLVFRSS